MSSYLGDIVQYIRGINYIPFRDRIYLGNDINAIDIAYSETENHKLSVFFPFPYYPPLSKRVE